MKRNAARALALGLPVLALAVLWAMIIAPLSGFFGGLQDQRAYYTALIAGEQRQIAQGPAWRAALADMQTQTSQVAGLRTEASEALASAGLQNDVQQIVAQFGGQVLSVAPLPPVAVQAYQAIALQISLSIPAGSVGALLGRIETGQPYMFIKAASFQGTDSGAPGANAAAPITLLCTIAAYRRP
jgi:general secretion pathway protein M